MSDEYTKLERLAWKFGAWILRDGSGKVMSEKCQCGHDYDDHVHRFGSSEVYGCWGCWREGNVKGMCRKYEAAESDPPTKGAPK